MSQVIIYVKLWDLVWAPTTGRDHDRFAKYLSYHLGGLSQSLLMRSASGHLIGAATIYEPVDLWDAMKATISAVSETYNVHPHHPRDIEVVLRKDATCEYLWITDYEQMHYTYCYDVVGESAADDFFA